MTARFMPSRSSSSTGRSAPRVEREVDLAMRLRGRAPAPPRRARFRSCGRVLGRRHAREGRELVHQRLQLVDLLDDGARALVEDRAVVAELRAVAPAQALRRELDRRERVLDLVRDPARDLAPRLHALDAQEMRDVLEEEHDALRAARLVDAARVPVSSTVTSCAVAVELEWRSTDCVWRRACRVARRRRLASQPVAELGVRASPAKTVDAAAGRRPCAGIDARAASAAARFIVVTRPRGVGRDRRRPRCWRARSRDSAGARRARCGCVFRSRGHVVERGRPACRSRRRPRPGCAGRGRPARRRACLRPAAGSAR